MPVLSMAKWKQEEVEEKTVKHNCVQVDKKKKKKLTSCVILHRETMSVFKDYLIFLIEGFL